MSDYPRSLAIELLGEWSGATGETMTPEEAESRVNVQLDAATVKVAREMGLSKQDAWNALNEAIDECIYGGQI